MAQENERLVQRLLESCDVSGVSTEVKGKVLRLLSNDSSGRTNQFEVKSRLVGLVEKYRILNNDALGDALQLRLDELPTFSSQWTPDILAFLLALSNRPLQHTRVEDLALLGLDLEPATLTWADILKEDPLDDQSAIWRNIDFVADGSDEEGDIVRASSESSADDERFAMSDKEEREADLEAFIVAVEKNSLEEISTSQAWRKASTKVQEGQSTNGNDAFEILEIDAIREVLFMLLGLPTSIFQPDDKRRLKLHKYVKFCHTSPESVTHLLNTFLDFGQKLYTLRRWTTIDLELPLEQAFQSALDAQLRLFHSTIHDIQKRFLSFPHNSVASLIDVCDEVLSSCRLAVQLHHIVVNINRASKSERPFKILENLYGQTCANQKVGDDEGYENLGRIFFQCFQIYLDPIREWMETGEVSQIDPVMFIEKAAKDVPLHTLWKEQYRLLHWADGTLKSPQFLHLAGKKIFNTGKSVNFLKKLDVSDLPQPSNDAFMSFESVCVTMNSQNLVPFPELFNTAFAEWIASKHHSSSVLLRNQLESQYGLQKALDALSHIYLYSNGACSKDAVRPLFEKIIRGKQYWNDPFTSTDLFHNAFVGVGSIDLNRLSIRNNDSKRKSDIKPRSMNMLENLVISYVLPWPIANIIGAHSIVIYQRVFVLLTQIERARFLLQCNKLTFNTSNALCALRTHLLWFVNTLLSHLTTLVIAVETEAMRNGMDNAEDLDSMIAVHESYIGKLEDHCFVAKQHTSLHRAVISILDLTILCSDLQATFSPNGQQHMDSKSSSDEDEGEDGTCVAAEGTVDARPQLDARAASIFKTYKQLFSIVAAYVEGISKASGGLMWTTFSSQLTSGSVR